MLDFYIISDETNSNAKNVQKQTWIKSMEYDVFDYLKSINIIEERFDDYSTFRWSAAFVKQKINLIENSKYRTDKNVIELLEILNDANRQQCGLIVFGD